MCSLSLVLASMSPRRRDLLAAIGVRFEVRPANIEERLVAGESPWQGARRLALAKLQVAVSQCSERVVLAADTVVDLDGRMLGKPASADDARRMLRALRGREHRVHTGVTVASAGCLSVGVCTTSVLMRSYTDRDIGAYIESGDHADKAGAYAIQNTVLRPVAGFDGSFSNVMGLPLGLTANLLETAGVDIDAVVEDVETKLVRDLSLT